MALTTGRSFPTAQGQHYEEEKRAMSHEIVALNSHLLEAKVTIDKLSEDNVSAVDMWQMLSGGFPGEAVAGRAFLILRDCSLAPEKGVGRAVRTWSSVQGNWERNEDGIYIWQLPPCTQNWYSILDAHYLLGV